MNITNANDAPPLHRPLVTASARGYTYTYRTGCTACSWSGPQEPTRELAQLTADIHAQMATVNQLVEYADRLARAERLSVSWAVRAGDADRDVRQYARPHAGTGMADAYLAAATDARDAAATALDAWVVAHRTFRALATAALAAPHPTPRRRNR